jgi:hypothetical protein
MNYYRAHILPMGLLRLTRDSEEIDVIVTPEIAESLSQGLQVWHPPLIREHEGNGSSEGVVAAIYHDAEGVYAIVWVSDPATAQSIDQGRTRWVSVGMTLGGADNSGTPRGAMLYELSLASVPAFAVGQQPLRRAGLDDLAAAGMRDPTIDAAPIAASGRCGAPLYISSRPVTRVQASTTTPAPEAPMEELQAQVAALTETIAALDARVAALESAGAPAEGTQMPDDMSAAMAEKDAEVYALNLVIANPALAPIKDALITLSRVDRGQADKLAKSGIVKASALPVRDAAPTAAPATGGGETLQQRALRIQAARRAEGKPAKFNDCLAEAAAAN